MIIIETFDNKCYNTNSISFRDNSIVFKPFRFTFEVEITTDKVKEIYS